MKRFGFNFLFVPLLILTWSSVVPAGGNDLGYRSPEAVKTELTTIAKEHGDVAAVQTLASSFGNREVQVLKLGAKDSQAPAILVLANMDGDCPPATEAALTLAMRLVGDWSEELSTHRWYIVPLGNPDGYAHFFASPWNESSLSDRAVNADLDDATDEDGPDDLNGDGYITMMRQEHPEGTWIPVEDNPVLMKRAEAAKGEAGKYRLFSEGIDNDGDGKINEDAPGGVIVGRNFPHSFKHYRKSNGMWAASEPESRGILRFAFDHPEIAMTLVFGRSNSLAKVPEGGKKASASQSKYKLPKGVAKQMGVDEDAEFTLAELVEMGKDYTGYQDLTEEMVLQFLGVGAAVNPDRNDLPYWTEISDRYNEFLKDNELDSKRIDPPKFEDGCIEEWSYYQYGVPTFSMDFWTPPVVEKEAEEKPEGALSPEEIEKMSNEEFIALGPEKIGEFLKAAKAPAQYTPDMVIMALQGGMLDTKKIAEFMTEAKKKDESGGADETEQAIFDANPDAFVQWQPYDHPTLGQVEIGGMIPYADRAPQYSDIETTVAKQLEFLPELAKLLPDLSVADIKVERAANNVWRIDAWISNSGLLPYPTYQGKRCNRPPPVVAALKGGSVKFLEGRERTALDLLDGSGGSQKVSWLVEGKEGNNVTLEVSAPSIGVQARSFALKEGGAQ